jgi:trehalose 6-phosphate phosphatase
VLEASPDWALFLDVDGTLLHFAQTPDAVVVSEQLRAALGRIAPLLDHALALISGRPIAELDRLFAPLRLPVAGLHGLERRDAAGRLHLLADDEGLNELRDPLAAFAARCPGVLLEDKGRALALHYRQAPEAEAEARRLVGRLVAAGGGGLRMLDGKMVLEIKPDASHKGDAIAAFMREPPFAGRCPVFAGDDVTDEDGFEVVNELGGVSVLVDGGRETAASHRLDDVGAVLDWLSALPDALAGAGVEERA